MKKTGNVIKYGDNIDTDVIIPRQIPDHRRPDGAGSSLYGGSGRNIQEPCKGGVTSW